MDNLDQPAGDPAWRFRGFQTWPASLDAQRDFLTIAASLAALSTHPCAPDLLRVALWNSRGSQKVTGFQEAGEKGFGGLVQLPGEPAPRAALIGTAAFLAEAGLAIPDVLKNAAQSWEEDGAPVFFCAWDGQAHAALRFGG